MKVAEEKTLYEVLSKTLKPESKCVCVCVHVNSFMTLLVPLALIGNIILGPYYKSVCYSHSTGSITFICSLHVVCVCFLRRPFFSADLYSDKNQMNERAVITRMNHVQPTWLALFVFLTFETRIGIVSSCPDGNPNLSLLGLF